MTSSKYCLKTRNKIKLSNAEKLDDEEDHDLFLSNLTSVLCCDTFNKFPLNSSLGRIPLSELAQELKTNNFISKFEEFDYYTDSEDESPYIYTCSFVLAIMYFERLKASNPSYLKSINSSELFLISLLVASKYLYDDGELDSAINCEWAAAYGIDLKTINQMEKDYLSAMNWQFFVSNEEFTIRHKQIVQQLYGDMKKFNSTFMKIFLLISSVVHTIKKLYRKKILRQKIKQMVAMSTLISVIMASTMQFNMNFNNQKLVQELYQQIKSDPNYPTIQFTQTNSSVNLEYKKDTSIDCQSSKLEELDHLLFMNICLSNNYHKLYQTTYSKSQNKLLQNSTYFKNIVLFNYI